MTSTLAPVQQEKLAHPKGVNKRDRDWNKPYGGALSLGYNAHQERDRARASAQGNLQRYLRQQAEREAVLAQERRDNEKREALKLLAALNERAVEVQS